MRKIVMIRTYRTEFEFDVNNDDDALRLFEEMDDEYKYNEEMEQMDVEEEIKVYRGGIINK
jgi:tellurite resistance protein